MATMLERTKMIFHGAWGRDPTNDELARVAEGLLSVSPEEYAAMPDAEKVKIIPRKTRQWMRRDVLAYEGHVAAQAAREAAEEDVETNLPDADL